MIGHDWICRCHASCSGQNSAANKARSTWSARSAVYVLAWPWLHGCTWKPLIRFENDLQQMDSGFRTPQAKISWIPESGLPYMGRYVKSDDRTTSQAVSQDWCGQVAWFVILIPMGQTNPQSISFNSSVYTKRFYELWRCAALSSIFKSSFSSNAICIVIVKWIFSFICFFWRLHFPHSLECGSGLISQTVSRYRQECFYGMIDKQHQKWKEKCENEMQLDLYKVLHLNTCISRR